MAVTKPTQNTSGLEQSTDLGVQPGMNRLAKNRYAITELIFFIANKLSAAGSLIAQA
jgi:hypothetical protein